jgi:hypothetical protein
VRQRLGLGVRILNVSLLLASGLLTLLGIHVSLLTGLNPFLALLILFFWLLLGWLAVRLSATAPKPAHWRTAMPALLLLATLFFFAYTFEFLRQQYLQEHGSPRRYYSWDTSK